MQNSNVTETASRRLEAFCTRIRLKPLSMSIAASEYKKVEQRQGYSKSIASPTQWSNMKKTSPSLSRCITPGFTLLKTLYSIAPSQGSGGPCLRAASRSIGAPVRPSWRSSMRFSHLKTRCRSVKRSSGRLAGAWTNATSAALFAAVYMQMLCLHSLQTTDIHMSSAAVKCPKMRSNRSWFSSERLSSTSRPFCRLARSVQKAARNSY